MCSELGQTRQRCSSKCHSDDDDTCTVESEVERCTCHGLKVHLKDSTIFKLATDRQLSAEGFSIISQFCKPCTKHCKKWRDKGSHADHNVKRGKWKKRDIGCEKGGKRELAKHNEGDLKKKLKNVIKDKLRSAEEEEERRRKDSISNESKASSLSREVKKSKSRKDNMESSRSEETSEESEKKVPRKSISNIPKTIRKRRATFDEGASRYDNDDDSGVDEREAFVIQIRGNDDDDDPEADEIVREEMSEENVDNDGDDLNADKVTDGGASSGSEEPQKTDEKKKKKKTGKQPENRLSANHHAPLVPGQQQIGSPVPNQQQQASEVQQAAATAALQDAVEKARSSEVTNNINGPSTGSLLENRLMKDTKFEEAQLSLGACSPAGNDSRVCEEICTDSPRTCVTKMRLDRCTCSGIKVTAFEVQKFDLRLDKPVFSAAPASANYGHGYVRECGSCVQTCKKWPGETRSFVVGTRVVDCFAVN